VGPSQWPARASLVADTDAPRDLAPSLPVHRGGGLEQNRRRRGKGRELAGARLARAAGSNAHRLCRTVPNNHARRADFLSDILTNIDTSVLCESLIRAPRPYTGIPRGFHATFRTLYLCAQAPVVSLSHPINGIEKNLSMPAGSPDIPNFRERPTLQSLRHGRWSSIQSLLSIGPKTIAGMLRKGWIEVCVDGGTDLGKCRITDKGRAAFSAKILTPR
jgi:hypothetical protein